MVVVLVNAQTLEGPEAAARAAGCHFIRLGWRRAL